MNRFDQHLRAARPYLTPDDIRAKRRERRLFTTGISDIGRSIPRRALVARALKEAAKVRRPALFAYVTQCVRDRHWGEMYTAAERRLEAMARGEVLP